MMIKQFQASDWQAYRAIRREALINHADRFGGTLEQEDQNTESDYKRFLSDHNCAFFGLYDDAEVVGSTAIFTDREHERTAILAGSYIREAYRGQKLSRLFYQARIDWARGHGGFDRIEVGHRQDNEASRKANQAFGFTWIAQKMHRFGDGKDDVLHVYEMRLR
jgi:RimJ/RimL family protein N-acetyltransferase